MTTPVRNARRVIENSGSVNPIQVDFKLENVADVSVYADDLKLSLGVDYTVTGVGADAGFEVNITNESRFSDRSRYAVVVRYPINQPSDVDLGGQFGKRFEAAVDRLAYNDQTLADGVRLAVKMPFTTPLDREAQFIKAEPGKLVGVDEDGNLTTTSDDIGFTGYFSALIEALKSLIGQAGPIETARFDTVTALELATIKDTITSVETGGYASSGDGGAWKVVKAVPNTGTLQPWQRQSNGGARRWELADQVVSPEQFGAFTDGSEASVKAGFVNMKSMVASKGVKWRLDRNYNIGTEAPAVSLSNCIASRGVELTGNVYLGPVTGLEGFPIKVHFDNRADGVAFPVFFDYVIDPDALDVPSQKDVFLTAGDVFDANYSVVDMSGMDTTYWAAGSGDNFVSETPASKTVDTVTWALSGSTGRWHIAWVPVTGGDEVAGAFSRDTFTRGVFIRTSSGFEYLYAFPDQPSGIFGVKLEGAAPSEVVYTIPGAPGDIANRFRNAELTVRLKSPNSYSVLANGYEIVPLRRTYSGDNIVAVGYGVFENATINASVKNLVKSRKSEQHGLYPVRVGILGNSISGDNAFGRWDVWLRQYLDTSMGMRLTGTVNVAVSGTGTAGILEQSTLPEIANCNCVVIATPGTNDTQYNVAVSTSIANLTATIDNIVSAGKKCVMMIEPMWYIQSMVGGQGGPAQNHERGAELRTAIRRLCAVKDVPCVDMQQINGFTNPAYVNAQDVTDPLIRDNIHPSALGYKLLAFAAARAILQAYAPKPTREVKSAIIKATGAYSWLAAGWSAGSRTPTYSISEDGRATLNGIVVHNNADSPAVALTVPINLRPSSNLDLTLSMFNGTTNSIVFGTLGVNGQLTIYGVPNAGQLRLDGANWLIA